MTYFTQSQGVVYGGTTPISEDTGQTLLDIFQREIDRARDAGDQQTADVIGRLGTDLIIARLSATLNRCVGKIGYAQSDAEDELGYHGPRTRDRR